MVRWGFPTPHHSAWWMRKQEAPPSAFWWPSHQKGGSQTLLLLASGYITLLHLWTLFFHHLTVVLITSESSMFPGSWGSALYPLCSSHSPFSSSVPTWMGWKILHLIQQAQLASLEQGYLGLIPLNSFLCTSSPFKIYIHLCSAFLQYLTGWGEENMEFFCFKSSEGKKAIEP